MKIKLFGIGLFLLVVIGCNPKSLPKGQVNYINFSSDVLTVKSTGYAKHKSDLLRVSKINAVDMVLFRGVAGSSMNKPMIGPNESEIKAKNKSFFEAFYASEFENFINNYTVVSEAGKVSAGVYSKTLEVKINTTALRRYLQTNKIIKKFGL